MTLSYSPAHQQGCGTTEVVAVLLAIIDQQPCVLTVDHGKLLPNGPLMPLHRSLQAGVRQWVEEQTRQPLGYIEQLYTFVDTNRRNADGHALVYVSYMGLVPESQIELATSAANTATHSIQSVHSKASPTASSIQTSPIQAQWQPWYSYFPWENHLQGRPAPLLSPIIAHLQHWADSAKQPALRKRRWQRIALCWGGVDSMALNEHQMQMLDNPSSHEQWIAEHALLRYEMLYEAGLIPESADYQPNKLPSNWLAMTGQPMYYDHRRVIATAISRLRAKIEYRPLIFGLMPEQFTLSQLQQSVEALSGVRLHKQNFRRLLESQQLLSETGQSSHAQRGRPAKLYRFRHDIELQSLLMDSKLPRHK